VTRAAKAVCCCCRRGSTCRHDCLCFLVSSVFTKNNSKNVGYQAILKCHRHMFFTHENRKTAPFNAYRFVLFVSYFNNVLVLFTRFSFRRSRSGVRGVPWRNSDDACSTVLVDLVLRYALHTWCRQPVRHGRDNCHCCRRRVSSSQERTSKDRRHRLLLRRHVSTWTAAMFAGQSTLFTVTVLFCFLHDGLGLGSVHDSPSELRGSAEMLHIPAFGWWLNRRLVGKVNLPMQ